MSIEEVRLRNMARYARSRKPPTNELVVAEYGSRDDRTGLRIMKLPDGGIKQGRFISNSEPEANPVFLPGRSLGSIGFIDQKPR